MYSGAMILLRPGIRVLVLAALIALAVFLYPPWGAEVQEGTLDMSPPTDVRVQIESLGYAWLWAAPSPRSANCNFIQYGCWVDVRWNLLWLELAAVAALGAVGFLADRRIGRRPA